MNFDPAPLFAASLIPYLLFLHWLRKSEALPLMAERGFQLTLLFVAHPQQHGFGDRFVVPNPQKRVNNS